MKKILVSLFVAAVAVSAVSAQVTVSGRAMWQTLADFSSDVNSSQQPSEVAYNKSTYDLRIGVSAQDPNGIAKASVTFRASGAIRVSASDTTTNATIFDEGVLSVDVAKALSISGLTATLTAGYTDWKPKNYSDVENSMLAMGRLYDRIAGVNSVTNSTAGNRSILASGGKASVVGFARTKDGYLQNAGYKIDVGVKELTFTATVMPGAWTTIADSGQDYPIMMGVYSDLGDLKAEVAYGQAHKGGSTNHLYADASYKLGLDKSTSLTFGAAGFFDLGGWQRVANGTDDFSTATILYRFVTKFSMGGDIAMNFSAGIGGDNRTGGGLDLVGFTYEITPMNIITLKGIVVLDTFNYGSLNTLNTFSNTYDHVLNTVTVGLEKTFGPLVIGAGYIWRGTKALNLDGQILGDGPYSFQSNANKWKDIPADNGVPYIWVGMKF